MDKNCVQWLALALPVVICTPDTMLPFILLMVGQFDDSFRSSENTALDGRVDKKITNWKGSRMKHSCHSLEGLKKTKAISDTITVLRYYFRLAFHKVD